MSTYADLAIAAAKAEDAAVNAEEQARVTREHAAAQRAIFAAAQRLGVELDIAAVEREGPYATTYSARVRIDPDAHLRLSFDARTTELEVSVQPCDQIYWDLPPGEERKTKFGGVYGCFGLDHYNLAGLKTTADVGRALLRVRRARDLWCCKHGVDR